eukprot:480863_1
MMKLFFLTLLFVVSFGDFSVTVTQCTTSGTCTGDDCTTQTAKYPSGCVAADTASTIVVCGGGWFNTTTWSSTDCSGDSLASIDWPSETCVDLSQLGGGSVKTTCGAANTLSILFGVIMVFIASLFQ